MCFSVAVVFAGGIRGSRGGSSALHSGSSPEPLLIHYNSRGGQSTRVKTHNSNLNKNDTTLTPTTQMKAIRLGISCQL